MFSRGTLERKGLKKGSSGCRLQIFNVCLTILWALGITYKAESFKSPNFVILHFTNQDETKEEQTRRKLQFYS